MGTGGTLARFPGEHLGGPVGGLRESVAARDVPAERLGPVQEVPSAEGPGLVAAAGPTGALAILVGLLVLGTGVAVALRQGPRRHALAVFAASWLVLPIALIGRSSGEFTAFREIVRLGPAVTPKDLAAGLSGTSAVTACAFLGLLLGLVGSVAALSRSREDGPAGE